MTRYNPPQVCVLTPAGRGAIAVVAIAGEGAECAVDRWFRSASRKSLSESPIGRIAFGRWGAEDGEEVVVTRHQYAVEVHCHGGTAASRAIVESLVSGGCVAVDQASWLHGTTTDPIASAARVALGKALTQQAALVLLDQFNGALRLAVEQIVASIDAGRPPEATEALATLLSRQALGKRLTTPARVVLTGPPNVGKSSLINVLVGYERSIVFDTPGTTRDVVTATTAIGGWAVEFIDTAGLRLMASGVEQAGIDLARAAIANADLVLRVADAKSWIEHEPPIALFEEPIGHQRVIDVANKVDLIANEELALLQHPSQGSLLLTSATRRTGIEVLLAAIDAAVTPEALKPGVAVPFTREQVEAVATAHEQLERGDQRAARQALIAMLYP